MNLPQERLQELLQACLDEGASDLHLSSNSKAYWRLHGRLKAIDERVYSPDMVTAMADSLMNEAQRRCYDEVNTVDLATSLPGGTRFRVNVYRERGLTALAIRRLDDRFRSLHELGLPESMREFTTLHDGLILVTGITGSGKTTTLSTLLNVINDEREVHIITIEDPIEYVHSNRRSLIHQRELHSDVPSFADAVRASLREDPDVLLVGEMRDAETMRAAITAAETGHLVFSTLHTGDAVGAIDRVLGVFSGAELEAIRHQLSMVLKAVVAQKLLRRQDREGRVPVVEILRITTAVANLIRTGRPQQIYSLMETGSEHGMITLEASLADLARKQIISVDEARSLARNPGVLESRMRAKITVRRASRRM